MLAIVHKGGHQAVDRLVAEPLLGEVVDIELHHSLQRIHSAFLGDALQKSSGLVFPVEHARFRKEAAQAPVQQTVDARLRVIQDRAQVGLVADVQLALDRAVDEEEGEVAEGALFHQLRDAAGDF